MHQVGTGGASGEWSGSQARFSRGEWSDKPGIRAGSATNQTGTGTGNRNRIQGPGETHTKAESAGLAIP
ncbi:unnamed protein product [Staurois parvus]|uniref:Uncharacterized protein n=1 Tax=Staurois parvus TaxID=386267 RepID=A0ABN9CQY9_9NEOB|nr:unnamed protein product [Staurois parvus]